MVRKKEPYEIFEAFAKCNNKAERVALLKENNVWALRDLIRGAMDKSLEWAVPDKPPYEPAPLASYPSTLLRENRMFTYFLKGGKSDRISDLKREKIYLGLLESIHPEDAKLVIKMVAKEKLAEGLTKGVVKEAWPDLKID